MLSTFPQSALRCSEFTYNTIRDALSFSVSDSSVDPREIVFNHADRRLCRQALARPSRYCQQQKTKQIHVSRRNSSFAKSCMSRVAVHRIASLGPGRPMTRRPEWSAAKAQYPVSGQFPRFLSEHKPNSLSQAGITTLEWRAMRVVPLFSHSDTCSPPGLAE